MDRPIALFDSGVGGLTVLQQVMQLLPNENYIYLADSGFFPYGVKTFGELEFRLQRVAKFLVSLNVKAIVIACNTASLHVQTIRNVAKIPVIDVISPTCEKVVAVSHNKKVCLLATDATVSYGKYQQVLVANGIDVLAVACSNFVPLVESGACNTGETQRILREKLLPIADLSFDTAILGCTHFGLLKESICKVLGNKYYVECGEPTALSLRKTLLNNNLLGKSKRGCLKVMSTGNVAGFDCFSKFFPFDLTDAQVVQLP